MSILYRVSARSLSLLAISYVFFVSFPVLSQTINFKWQQVPGRSLDIGVGHRGHVWSIGPNRQAWRFVSKKWVRVPGIKNLINIDAAPDGSAMAAARMIA